MNSNKASKEIFILPSNTERNYLCDYVIQTAKVLGKEYFTIIIYYKTIYSLFHLFFHPNKLTQLLKEWKNIIFLDDQGIYECSFIAFLPFQRFRMIYETNKKLTIIQLKILLAIKNIVNTKEYLKILWIFSPEEEFFVGKLREKTSLYDCVDDLEDLTTTRKDLFSLERRLIKKVDFVFTISQVLTESKKELKEKAIVVPCGCSLDNFPFNYKSKEIPHTLRKIIKPIIGFIGYIYYRIDFQLMRYLLENNGKFSFVFIGEILEKIPSKDVGYQTIQEEVNKLKKYPNFFLLPLIQKEELKDYLSFFDIGIIPYDTTYKFVYHSNPMKFYEYLAMGIPTVSTNIPSIAQYSSRLIKAGKDFESFNKALRSIIADGKNNKAFKLKARSIAETNSWELKIGRIIKQINLH